MKVKLHFLMIGILGLLMGCTGLNADRYLLNKQTFMLNRGDPPAYVAGYVDGCATGRRLAGDRQFSHRKNHTRFEQDALYAHGWQQGQMNCRNEALKEQQLGINNAGKHKSTLEKEVADTKRQLKDSEKAVEAEMRAIWEQLKK